LCLKSATLKVVEAIDQLLGEKPLRLVQQGSDVDEQNRSRYDEEMDNAPGLIGAPHRRKINELESLRGLAALLVVFFHVPKWNTSLNVGIINNGYLMVELFFVLSGFVIFNAYGNNIKSTRDLLRFQFLRFGRLYPVHILFVLIFLLIEIAKYIAQSKIGIVSPNTQPFRQNSFTALIQHIFLVQAIGPTGNHNTFNVPSWSISVEFVTYFIFGCVVLLGRNGYRNSIFLVVAIVSIVLLASAATFGFEDILNGFGGFFIGCLTAVAVKNMTLKVSRLLSLILFLAIIAFLQFKTSKTYDVAIYFLTAGLIGALVIQKNGLLNSVLRLNILTWLGTISYSLYMSHAAVEWVANQIFRVVLKAPEVIAASGRSIPQLSGFSALLGVSFIVIFSFGVSSFVYKFVEKPWRERSREFAFSRLTSSIAASEPDASQTK
jgi:peptidoglycan/LPS O-acetylase OafA/YrhL